MQKTQEFLHLFIAYLVYKLNYEHFKQKNEPQYF